MGGKKRRVLDVSGPVASATLSVGVILLLISLASKLTYDDLVRQNPGHARALRTMDVTDSVVAKLKPAEKALTDYSQVYHTSRASRTSYHWADPRESAGHLKTARKKIQKAMDGDRELTKAPNKITRLIKELHEVDVIRGERYYSSLRNRVGDVRSICESKLSSLSEGVPQAVVSRREKLRRELKITLTAGAIITAFGVLFCWSWYSDASARRRVQREREVRLQREAEEGASPPDSFG